MVAFIDTKNTEISISDIHRVKKKKKPI